MGIGRAAFSHVARVLAALAGVVVLALCLAGPAHAAEVEDQVRVIVENETFTTDYAKENKLDSPAWQGVLIDTWVDIDDDSSVMTAVADALKAEGIEQEGAEANYISMIGGLRAFAGGPQSGWMGTLNDWFCHEGFEAFTVEKGTLEAGDEIRIMYTVAWGNDLGGSYENDDKRLKALEFSVGTLYGDFNSDKKAYTLVVPNGTKSVVVTPTAMNKNFQVRASVSGAEFKRSSDIPVADGTIISVDVGKQGWPSLNYYETGYKGAAQQYLIEVRYDVVESLYGDSLYDTMEAITSSGFADGSCKTVILATSGGFPDALAASGFAGILGCPTLLTNGEHLTENAAREIERLGAEKVYVMGGTAVIKDQVIDDVEALNGVKEVERVCGYNAWDTSDEIYLEGAKAGVWGKTALVATSYSFMDALSAAPFGYFEKAPMFLTNAGTKMLEADTAELIKSAGFDRVVIIGGPGIISEGVEEQLAGAGLNVERKYGWDAYETSNAVAEWCVSEGMDDRSFAIATGRNYYDALSGAALCGKMEMPLLLVDEGSYYTFDNFVESLGGGVDRVCVFGGPSVVTQATKALLAELIYAS